MAELIAEQAAKLAEDVYALTNFATLRDAIDFLGEEYRGKLDFSEDRVVKGKTGAPFLIRCRTGFGFTVLGQGALKGKAFFIFRGTEYLADWFTNVTATVSSTSSGMPAHTGFNQTFNSMRSHLVQFMSMAMKAGVTELHCIGHSLGGALATICADWIANTYKIKPYLYTFGSPRVGLHGFASHCTKKVGAPRIYRTYHKTDIVPCMPVWPFFHAPLPGSDYYLPSPGVIPTAEYHGIRRYMKSVRGSSWEQLGSLKEQQKDEAGVERWLRQPGPIGLTITTIDWLNQALLYVLNKCMTSAADILSTSFSTTFTLMDQLAIILKKGIDLSKSVSSLVLLFIAKVMQVLGMKKVVDAATLTRDFIRSILMRLQARMSAMTRDALSKVLVKGRAI